MSDPNAGQGGAEPPVPVRVLRSQLRGLGVAERLRLSLFVVLLGFGYVTGFLYILMTTVPEGKSPDPAQMPHWIALKYHGSDTPLLLQMIGTGGKMRKYLADPATNEKKIADWYAGGMKEAGFKAIQPIFSTVGPENKSCLSCHVRMLDNGDSGEMASAPLENYNDVKAEMRTGGMSFTDLAKFSHFHLIGMALMAIGFTWVWLKTAIREPWRGIFLVLPFAGIVCDIGGWWLTKLTAPGAYVVLLGGALYGIASLVLTLGPLIDMWRPLPADAQKADPTAP
ncbi:MAG: hypothetical protein ACREJ2_14520 [Planctomycetota bacterium]